MAKLNVEVGVNRTAFDRGLDSMRKQANNWAASMASTLAGAFAIGSMVNWFNSFRTEMDRVGKLAARLGESTATIQRVGEAASMAGADIEMVVKAMSRLAVEAGNGSEKFEALGISAEAFANAGLEQKMVMLSGAYQEAASDQSKMIALMDLLGTRAQDLIPLLAAGPEALRQGFADASIVSDYAIRQTEKFNDLLEKLSLVGRSFFGWFIQAVATVGLGVTHLKDQIVILAKAMDPRNFFGGMSEAAQKFADDSTAAFEKFKRGYNEIWGDPKEWTKPKKTAQVEDQEDIKRQAKEAEDLAKRAEQIGERELKRQMDKMTVAQRILTLEQIRAALLQRSADSATTEAERVTIAEKVLSLEEQITAEKKAQAAEQAKTANAALSLAERVMKRNLDAMDPEKRIETLEGMKKALQDAAVNPALTEDQRIDAANRLLDIEDQIAQAKKDKADADEKAKKEAEDAAKTDEKSTERSSVISSSLAEVGGGGGAYVAMSTEARELQSQTQLLRQLVNNTAPQTQRTGRQQPAEAF